MKANHSTDKQLTHHAYYFVGNEVLRDELISGLEKHYKIAHQGNPDLLNQSFETLTIDDARNIKSFHQNRPIHDEGKKVSILLFSAITSEAQNALLKLLEEPSEHALFFLIVPTAHILLPTVKSRLAFRELNDTGEFAWLFSGQNNAQNVHNAQGELFVSAQKFLKLSLSKRLDFVKSLVDDISKEKKKKQYAIDFLDAVQQVIYKEKGVTEGRESLNVISHARTYMNDRSPSIKMLLEYVALNA